MYPCCIFSNPRASIAKSVEVVAGDFVNVAAVETELESVSSQDSVLDDVPGVDDSYVEGDDHSNDAKVSS